MANQSGPERFSGKVTIWTKNAKYWSKKSSPVENRELGPKVEDAGGHSGRGQAGAGDGAHAPMKAESDSAKLQSPEGYNSEGFLAAGTDRDVSRRSRRDLI